MHPFAAAFVAALVLATATRVWLALRHIRHVGARRAAVPDAFAGRVALEAHQKAADYTVAKTRLSIYEAIVTAVLALALTLGGGLEAIASAWTRVLEPGGYAHGIALLLTVGLVAGIVDLPFSLYRSLVIEARFGFKRMT